MTNTVRAHREPVVRKGDSVQLETNNGNGPPGSITIFNIGTKKSDPGGWAHELIGKSLGSFVTLSGQEHTCKITSIRRD